MIKNEFVFQHINKLKQLLPKKDFLIVGKGPTLSKWSDSFLDKFNVIGINHVAERFKTLLSHFTDYETFVAQGWHSPYVIVSGMMNQNYQTSIELKYLSKNDVTFSKLYKDKRVFTYDIKTESLKNSKLFSMSDPFVFKYASGVLLIQVAIVLGLQRVYTLGIDGGVEYHTDFEILRGNGLFLDNQIHLMSELAAKNSLEIIKL